MDKELKKDIKKLLLADSLLITASSISKTLDDIEDELEELLGKSHDKRFKIEDLFKTKTLK
jgi:hypothetical protein